MRTTGSPQIFNRLLWQCSPMETLCPWTPITHTRPLVCVLPTPSSQSPTPCPTPHPHLPGAQVQSS